MLTGNVYSTDQQQASFVQQEKHDESRSWQWNGDMPPLEKEVRDWTSRVGQLPQEMPEFENGLSLPSFLKSEFCGAPQAIDPFLKCKPSVTEDPEEEVFLEPKTASCKEASNFEETEDVDEKEESTEEAADEPNELERLFDRAFSLMNENPEVAEVFDVAKKCLDQLEIDRMDTASLNDMALKCVKGRDYENAIEYLRRAADLYGQSKNFKEMQEALLQAACFANSGARQCIEEENFVKMEKFLTNVAEFCDRAEMPSKKEKYFDDIALHLHARALSYIGRKCFVKPIECFKYAIRCYGRIPGRDEKTAECWEGMVVCYQCAANDCIDVKDWGKAKEYYEEASKIHKKRVMPKKIVKSFRDLAKLLKFSASQSHQGNRRGRK